METLFITPESRLKRHENTVQIHVNGKKRSVPVEHIGHLVLLGPARLNTALLELCGKQGVRISVFDYYGYFRGAFEPVEANPSGEVRLRQAACILDDDHRMAIAREMVRGAIHNISANLRYYSYRGLEEAKRPLKEIERLADDLPKADTTERLMGIEGNVHAWYYPVWEKIDPQLAFTPRVRRPPNNPINCLVSFLNQLVYTVVRHELSKTHLDASLAFLHSAGRSRNSLALDLAEPFKPILVDTLIFRMVRKKMLVDNWFEQKPGVCLLTETGRRHVVEAFSQRLEEPYQNRTYREWIYLEALALEQEVMGTAEYESFKRRV